MRVHRARALPLLLALLTTGSGDARLALCTVRHLVPPAPSPARIGVLRGGGEAGESSADKELRQEGQAANASYEFGMEAMTQYDFESAVSRFTAGINVAPESARLLSSRAEAYASLNKMEQSLQDTMKVVVMKEQAFAAMAAPSQNLRGEPCSASVESDAEIVNPEEDPGVSEAEKLLGSLQLLADLMTRYPALAQDEACTALSHFLSALARSAVRQRDDAEVKNAKTEEAGRDLQDARKTMLSRLTSLLADHASTDAKREQVVARILQRRACQRPAACGAEGGDCAR